MNKKIFSLVGLSAVALCMMQSAYGLSSYVAKDPTSISDTDAYNWAYSKNITTQSTLAKANLGGPIRRYELAKMLTQFYIKVGKRAITPNPQCDITKYSDYATFTNEQKLYVYDICNIGLMGWNKDKTSLISTFNPTGILSAQDTNTVIIRYIRLTQIAYSFTLPTSITRGDIFRFLLDMSGETPPASSSNANTSSAGGGSVIIKKSNLAP